MLSKLGSYLLWPTSAFSSKSRSMMMSGFKEVETQFIAALGDPKASAGTGADQWGIWRIDPGPRGVRLQNFKQLGRRNCVLLNRYVSNSQDIDILYFRRAPAAELPLGGCGTGTTGGWRSTDSSWRSRISPFHRGDTSSPVEHHRITMELSV